MINFDKEVVYQISNCVEKVFFILFVNKYTKFKNFVILFKTTYQIINVKERKIIVIELLMPLKF
jgi:hypothetical protein